MVKHPPPNHPKRRDYGLVMAMVSILAFLVLVSPSFLQHFYPRKYNEYFPLLADVGNYLAIGGFLLISFLSKDKGSLSLMALLGLFCIGLLALLQLAAHQFMGRFSDVDLFYTGQMLLCFLAFWLLPSTLRAGEGTKLYPLFLILFTIGLCVYSLLTEWEMYLGLAGLRSAYDLNIRSIFYNRNSLGQLIFIAWLCVFLLRPKLGGLQMMVLALFALVLTSTLSRAALLGVIVFLFFYFLMNYSAKPNFYRILLFVGFLFILLLLYKPSLFSYLTRILFRGYVGDTGRSGAWIYGLKLMDAPGWLMGLGIDTSQTALQQSSIGLQHFHSYYIGNLVAGGLLLSCAHLFLFLEFVGLYQRLHRSDPSFATVYISSVFAFYAYALFDNAAFLIPGYEGVYITLLLLTLPLSHLEKTDVPLYYRKELS